MSARTGLEKEMDVAESMEQAANRNGRYVALMIAALAAMLALVGAPTSNSSQSWSNWNCPTFRPNAWSAP